MTPFQKRVYVAVAQIPSGKVTSYSALAHYINCRSAQAIGQALKKNPSAPEIPCHRVIHQTGFIGGYLGTISPQGRKYKLLRSEGVRVDDQGYLISDAYWWDWK